LTPYNPDVEPRFKCLRISNIPARRDIRVLIYRALQVFTPAFGPIVRFKMPGPFQTRARRFKPTPSSGALTVTAYVYFRSTAAPRFICSQHREVFIHGRQLALEVDKPTGEHFNPGDEVNERALSFDVMALPQQQQHILISLDDAERTFYECPDCLSRILLSNRMAHEQACRGRISSGAQEVADLRSQIYRHVKNNNDGVLMLRVLRLECPKCSKLMREMPAQSVLALKCGHYMCRGCVEQQKRFTHEYAQGNMFVFCGRCPAVCRLAETVDLESLFTGQARIQAIDQ